MNSRHPQNHPRIAVIVPAYNAADLLAKTLPALYRGTMLVDEVIVMDDASTDDTAREAVHAGARAVRLDKNRGPAFCRNLGAQMTQAEIVIFLDADTLVHSDTVARLVKRLVDDPRLAAVIGSYDEAPDDEGDISQFRNLAHRFVHAGADGQAWTFWSGCGAIRRQTLLRVGGFDASYTRPSIEDVELGYRLVQAGEAIALDSSIQVKHLKRWTLPSSLETDIFDRGIPWVRLVLEYRSAPSHLNISLRYRLSTAAVAAGWLCLAASVYRWQCLPLGLACFSAAVLLHLDLFRFLRCKRGWRLLASAVPMHLLQQTCNIVSTIAGTALHFCTTRPPRQLLEVPAEEMPAGALSVSASR